MTDLLLIFFSACLVNNLVLDHMLGVDPVSAMAGKIKAAGVLGLAVAVFAPPAALLGRLLGDYLLAPLDLVFLELPALLLLLAATVGLGSALLRHRLAHLYERIAVAIPLLLINTALPGVVLLDLQQQHGPLATLVFGLGSAAGMVLVITAFAALQERLAAADIPRPFRGAAIQFVTLGLFSMAFMGFAGLGPS